MIRLWAWHLTGELAANTLCCCEVGRATKSLYTFSLRQPTIIRNAFLLKPISSQSFPNTPNYPHHFHPFQPYTNETNFLPLSPTSSLTLIINICGFTAGHSARKSERGDLMIIYAATHSCSCHYSTLTAA